MRAVIFYTIRRFIMKKIFALAAVAVIALMSFVGCTQQAEKDVSDVRKAATDAVETVSEEVSDMMDSTNGDVKDDDGVIGNGN